MAGFGATVKESVAKEEAKKPVKVKEPKPITEDDTFAALAKEREQLKTTRPRSHDFIAIAGHEGTGKSGLVLDAYAKDANRHEKDQLWVSDFDGGGSMLHDSHYGDDRSIIKASEL